MTKDHRRSKIALVALSAALALALAASCSSTESSGTAASDASTTSSTATSGGSATSAGSAGGSGQGGGGDAPSATASTSAASSTSSGGGAGGASALEGALVGEWKPTQMAHGNQPPEPAPDGSPFWIFQANGDMVLGCATPPIGTWTLDESAPPPAIAVIHAVFGSNDAVDWYVLTLDTASFVFVEGGDTFYHERSACP